MTTIRYVRNGKEHSIVEIEGTNMEVTDISEAQASNMDVPWYESIQDAVADIYRVDDTEAVRRIQCLNVLM
jgi:hypothetical protein